MLLLDKQDPTERWRCCMVDVIGDKETQSSNIWLMNCYQGLLQVVDLSQTELSISYLPLLQEPDTLFTDPQLAPLSWPSTIPWWMVGILRLGDRLAPFWWFPSKLVATSSWADQWPEKIFRFFHHIFSKATTPHFVVQWHQASWGFFEGWGECFSFLGEYWWPVEMMWRVVGCWVWMISKSSGHFSDARICFQRSPCWDQVRSNRLAVLDCVYDSNALATPLLPWSNSQDCPYNMRLSMDTSFLGQAGWQWWIGLWFCERTCDDIFHALWYLTGAMLHTNIFGSYRHKLHLRSIRKDRCRLL